MTNHSVRHWHACLAALVLGCPTLLSAAPPVLTNITPRGVQPGRASVLTIAGANLTPRARLLLPFLARQQLLADAKPNPAQVRLQLTVAAAVPLGVYPVRLVTEDGVSAIFLLSVDAFPNVDEVEDNSSFAKAQQVPFPVIVTGTCPGGDVDFFRFSVRKGQHVVVETEAARLGSGIMPQLRVTDARRRLIAADDTQKVRGDCRVIFTAPEDGAYVVEVSDSRYSGGNPPFYRLKIGDYDVVEEVFPLGGRRGATVAFTLAGGTLARPVQVRRTLAAAPDQGGLPLSLDGAVRTGMLSPRVAVGDLPERLRVPAGNKDPKVLDVTAPVTVNGRLERPGATDRFQLAVQPGQRFRIAVQAEALGSNLDGVLRVTDQTGKQLALVDDVITPALTAGQQPTVSTDPALDLTVPAGTTLLVIDLRDQRFRGGLNFGYRLTIEPAVPDFVVHQPLAELNVPRGGSAVLTVPVTRRGYTGPLQLTMPNLPAGLTVQGGYVPEGGGRGVLTLSAAATAQLPAGVVFLQVEGSAVGTGQEIRRVGEQRLVMHPDPNLTAPVLTLRRFAVALTTGEPFAVQGPAAIEVVKGYPASVPVTVTRAANQAAPAVDVTGLTGAPAAVPVQPAAPFTFKPATAAAGAATAAFTVTAALNAPEGRRSDLLVQGQARINNVVRTVLGPAVAVTVRRPFTVELPATGLTLPAGKTVTVKGRLQRQAVFKEVVQIALAGLPKGVTLAAPLRPIAANQAEFQIDLRADPKAVAGMANLTLTFSTTIGGTAYAHPAVTVPVRVTP
jgi:hypothetical protein